MMTPNMDGVRVCIIDYGVGNLTSVKNAFTQLGVDAIISREKGDLEDATHLILPGVGSFGEGMKGLNKYGLVEMLQKEVLSQGKPILGICLGMQLFASRGLEYGAHEGLGFIPGTVEMLYAKELGLRLPHIGWNDVAVREGYSLTGGYTHKPVFYFLHSYRFLPEDEEVVAGVCEYGEDIVSIIEYKNIFGTQFHPEKSHDDGLLIFKNFLSC